MRKSVKYVAALLAATMTIGGLTGCVNSASSDTGSNTAASDSNAGVEESASSDNDYCEFPYKSRVMPTSEPLKTLKAPYMARNTMKWGFFRLKSQ